MQMTITPSLYRAIWLVAICFLALPIRAQEPSTQQINLTNSPLDEARQQILQHTTNQELSLDEINEWLEFSEEVKNSVKSGMSFPRRIERAIRNPWVFFGFFAQATFMMRFVLQLIASERKKRSYVPVAFWYLSLAGGLMLFVYALQRRDPVFVLGQGLGILIYARNLVLIYRRKDNLNNVLEERNRRNTNNSDTAGAETT